MANREAWCAEKLSKLANEDLRISTLTEIKDYISTISQDEVAQVANYLQLPLVFDCLNDSKSEQIDLACEVLTTCMTNLCIGESTNKYGIALERSLYHPSANVKLMALNEIHRTVIKPHSAIEVAQQLSLLAAIVSCIGDDDLGVAKKASDTLILIGKSPFGVKQMLASQVRQAFRETISINEVVRFRIYELVINIAKISEESLDKIVESGLISSLISELSSDDILLKLNVLELLSELALSTHGLVFLENKGVIKDVIHKFCIASQDSLALIILPGYLKFFGNVSHWRPEEMHSNYAHAFNTLFSIVNSEDLSILGVAFDTLGHIGSTCKGKIVLNDPEERILTTLKNLGNRLLSLPTDLRIRALNCIESLIKVPLDNDNNRIHTITEKWFNNLSDDSVLMMVKYAQNPFNEIRIVGLAILLALAEQYWGQEMIKNCPGLVEFLLDRKIETTKESKEIKYEIIKNLSRSPIFTGEVLNRLQQFVREGPFFVQAVTEVAIEGI